MVRGRLLLVVAALLVSAGCVGATPEPTRGARLSAPCDVLTPLSLVLSIEVPREGYVVRSFGFTYEVGGTTYRTTKRGWTYAACGTAPQELCSGQP